MMRVELMMIRTTMIAAATVIDAVHILFIYTLGGFDNSLACPDKKLCALGEPVWSIGYVGEPGLSP